MNLILSLLKLNFIGYTGGGGRPIPHEARMMMFRFLIDKIKRVSPKTLIALCLETEEMWKVFGKELGMSLNNYVCVLFYTG